MDAGREPCAPVFCQQAALVRSALTSYRRSHVRSVMPEPLPVHTTVGSTLVEGVMVAIDVIAVAPKRV